MVFVLNEEIFSFAMGIMSAETQSQPMAQEWASAKALRNAKDHDRYHNDPEFRNKKLKAVNERYHRLKAEPTETFENWKAANLARSKSRYVPKKPRISFN